MNVHANCTGLLSRIQQQRSSGHTWKRNNFKLDATQILKKKSNCLLKIGF